ncbi:MAG: hypothetical protein WBQ73_03500 [Candidatus Babeliales bacterium]
MKYCVRLILFVCSLLVISQPADAMGRLSRIAQKGRLSRFISRVVKREFQEAQKHVGDKAEKAGQLVLKGKVQVSDLYKTWRPLIGNQVSDFSRRTLLSTKDVFNTVQVGAGKIAKDTKKYTLKSLMGAQSFCKSGYNHVSRLSKKRCEVNLAPQKIGKRAALRKGMFFLAKATGVVYVLNEMLAICVDNKKFQELREASTVADRECAVRSDSFDEALCADSFDEAFCALSNLEEFAKRSYPRYHFLAYLSKKRLNKKVSALVKKRKATLEYEPEYLEYEPEYDGKSTAGDGNNNQDVVVAPCDEQQQTENGGQEKESKEEQVTSELLSDSDERLLLLPKEAGCEELACDQDQVEKSGQPRIKTFLSRMCPRQG